MSQVIPFTLRRLRKEKKLSQAQLAEIAKVSARTIWRIERGDQLENREHTIQQIARALDVSVEILTSELPVSDTKPEFDATLSRVNFIMTTHARNALTLVAERYCLHQTDILEIAPFLFYWAAESSLRERRKSVERLSHSIDEDARASELDSIDRCDLFGEALKDNPFELFLRDLAESVGENVSMDSFDFCDYPDYRICGEEAALIADGDADLAEQILEGSAPLHEVPKELNEPGMFRERGRWLRERLNEYRSEQMRRFTKLDQGEKTSA